MNPSGRSTSSRRSPGLAPRASSTRAGKVTCRFDVIFTNILVPYHTERMVRRQDSLHFVQTQRWLARMTLLIVPVTADRLLSIINRLGSRVEVAIKVRRASGVQPPVIA